MTRQFKIFLIAFLASLPFWWGANALNESLAGFFFWDQFARNPAILAAQADQLAFEQNLRNLKPVRDREAADLAVEARSFLSVFLGKQGETKILSEKNSRESLPIASVTKLMTARVVLENYDLSKEITVSRASVAQEENFGKLQEGKVFPTYYLLYPLLMESSNDAAFALANDYPGMSEEKFIGLMNREAGELGLSFTRFFNSTGLDPTDDESDELNRSSAEDLVVLVRALLKEPLIWEIMATPTYAFFGPELINTNKLLDEMTGIVGGKTGYTERALGCFLLVSEAPKGKGYLVSVILGTEADRFEEMKKIINWDKEAYIW